MSADLTTYAHLDALGITYQAIAFDPGLERGIASVVGALADRVAPRQIVKSLMFRTSRGEIVLALVSSDRSIVSAQLKKAVGDRNIQMASAQQIVDVSGYEVGSIPPFSWQPAGFRTFVDSALLSESVVAVGAGRWGEEILLAPADLVRAADARAAPLTTSDH